MNLNNTHPNYIVEMVAKYWPDCLYRPLLVAIAPPKSRLRELLVNNMKHNGAREYEIASVYDYYRYMDASMKIDIN